jgi:hypothetical protein
MSLPPVPVTVGPDLLPDHAIPERAGTRAIMANVMRQGEWTMPRLFRVMAFMGQVDLDLTHVRIGGGTSVIEVVAVMGQVNIVVPHNLRVESHGDPMLGEFKLKYTVTSAAGLDAPLIVIKGSAFMGGVTVKVVDPNAPKWHQRWLRRAPREDQGQLPGA